MKYFALFALLATVGLAGCDSNRREASPPDNESVKLFKEGKGVLFSDQTRNLFGVQVVEVAEKSVPCQVVKTAQVYRAAREDTPAAAMLLLDADELKELTLGQAVALKPSQDPGREITGKLVRLDAHAQAVFGGVEALVEFADAERQFAVGALLAATFTNEQTKAVTMIPRSALLTTAEGNFVYVVNGSHLTRTSVKSGATTGGFVEIQDGLYEGDSVAAKGLESLWLVELSALKGGTPCCPAPKKTVAK